MTDDRTFTKFDPRPVNDDDVPTPRRPGGRHWPGAWQMFADHVIGNPGQWWTQQATSSASARIAASSLRPGNKATYPQVTAAVEAGYTIEVRNVDGAIYARVDR